MTPCEVHLPHTVAEAVAMRRDLPESMYVAGGTDLLPNLKHRLHGARHLVSLSAVAALVGIDAHENGTLRIGAGTVLQEIADSTVVRAGAPALALAAGLVAGPQHRRMGTLGGNVMLDTRCLFYNQSASWREALGYCLKKDGDWCHVIGSPKRCVAAHSADTVPVLVALDAVLEVVHPEDGPTELPLEDLYVMDGRFEQNRALDPRCLVTAIRIPPRKPGHRSTYRKVRARRAVDFPQLGLAVVGAFDTAGICTDLTAVVSAVLPKPQRLKRLEPAVGSRLEDGVVEEIAEQAYRQVHPQTSIHGDPAWRRHMARVEMRRALQVLRGT